MRALAPADRDWPPGLHDLRDPPPRLYVRGEPPPAPARAAAVVGSRAASPYGSAQAERLARDLAALGVAVVSGLARGIDAAAHAGALAGGGVTYAVLPCALDQVTPREHAGLAARIAARGGLASEVGEGGPFGPGAFVRRNRLIAALAGVTVVVEAAAESGALRTAAAARALGRPVLAVPGDVDRPTARGTLALLRAGAAPCGDAGDVLAALRAAHPQPAAADPAARLLAALGPEPRPLEALAAAAALPVAEALTRLLRLEWSGAATPAPGQRWSRRGPA